MNTMSRVLSYALTTAKINFVKRLGPYTYKHKKVNLFKNPHSLSLQDEKKCKQVRIY